MRRHLSLLIVCSAAACLSGFNAQPDAAGPPASGRAEAIDRALVAAARFLVARQSADGAWRSDLYGPFKDGAALTPLVVQALQAVPPSAGRDAACRRGIAYLAAFAQADGSIEPGPHGFSYPVYTAAGAVALLSGEGPKRREARDAWLRYLRERQLTEELGWQPADKEYGGWGYCPVLPRKPSAGQRTPPLTESNLSATVAALEALQAAGMPADHPAVRKALVFCQRCQNFGGEPAFDDGGFFFIYDDPVRNKAGVAGTDKQGRERYRSYGSATADGLRALLLCGLSPDRPRVAAAKGWLQAHFSANAPPGRYASEREARRPALYYYYACSVARALRQAAGKEATAAAQSLAAPLLERQRDDGSWVNPQGFIREDEPLVATSFAMRALASLRSIKDD
jgi:hypothetical protein